MKFNRLLPLIALWSACDTSLSPSELEEIDRAALDGQARTKDEGGPNGDFNYCDGATPCSAGEGDCDIDAHCEVGLACGLNNGGQFGLHWSRDLCVAATCTNGIEDAAESGVDIGGTCGDLCGGTNGDDMGYCTVGCPCSEGEGDCSSDDQCVGGLTCSSNRDGQFGPPLEPSDWVCTGDDAAVGIADLSVGDLVITEIMTNPAAVPDTSGEWFEILNTTNTPIELSGLVVRKSAAGAASFVVGTSLVIAPNGYLTFARNGNTAANGGVVAAFDYSNVFALADTADSIILDSGPLDIDRVVYNAAFPTTAGSSIELDIQNLDDADNDVAANWCASVTPLPSGDDGTPGADNGTCPGLGVNLGTAGTFVILAKSAVSTVPSSVITGDIGLSPSAASFITGFSLVADPSNEFSTSAQVTGSVFAADYSPPTPIDLTTAVGDMELAFTDAASRAPDVTELGAGDIGGLTLDAGVYKWGSGLLIPTDLTLSGTATDVWIFQIAQDLTVSNGVQVVLSGGAVPENVFWQVSGLVDVGTTAHVEGAILSQTGITLATGSSVLGRLLAQTAVTLDTSTVVEP